MYLRGKGFVPTSTVTHPNTHKPMCAYVHNDMYEYQLARAYSRKTKKKVRARRNQYCKTGRNIMKNVLHHVIVPFGNGCGFGFVVDT